MDLLNDIVAKRGNRPHPWAILFVDLDRFKVVNDSLGHIAGDVVLVESARRFERCVRSCDTIARLGGDEFIILIDEIDDFEIAHDIARRALRTFDLPFEVSGREVFASASIGIATSPNGDDRPEDVLRNADIAMYRAKALGKNRYETFTPDLLMNAITRLEAETDLARALERNEFRLFYQPIISLHDGRLRGFEALVRWQHPTRGLVGPDQFIHILEENGAIVDIGEWILREGCRQLQAWRTTLVNAQDLRMNINVSAKQLASRGFVRTMESALSTNGLDPDGINMEITESVLMDNPDQARAILMEIKSMGVHIHLDDFGTGYSSLAYLRDFPIDALKIDKSFVSSSNASNAGATLASVEIIRTIVALAQSLALTITAEGVETDAQREQLRTLGCDRGQGYYFSRPLDASRAGAFIVARKNQTQERALERNTDSPAAV
jgi:diguanylate cyclase (GGDEF)-like protein